MLCLLSNWEKKQCNASRVLAETKTQGLDCPIHGFQPGLADARHSDRSLEKKKKICYETKAAMNSVLNLFPASWAQHFSPGFLFLGSTLIPPLSESTHSHSGSPSKHFNPLWEYHAFPQGHALLTESFSD